jgi:hypothetical protein
MGELAAPLDSHFQKVRQAIESGKFDSDTMFDKLNQALEKIVVSLSLLFFIFDLN